jgi:putative ABC transport system permease protein
MLNYYLKLAIRNFRKSILASVINVLGLSAGFTTVFFIAVWVHNELTYDRFHENVEDIYLLATREASEADFEEYSPLTEPRPDVFERYPEVKANVSIDPLDEARVSNGARFFSANGLAVTRPFFEVFNFPFLKGTHESYSDSMKVIYLTEGLAYKIAARSKELSIRKIN